MLKLEDYIPVISQAGLNTSKPAFFDSSVTITGPIAGNTGKSVTYTVGSSAQHADYIVDGIADGVQINAAFAALSSAGGGRVVFRKFDYVVEQVLNVPNNVTAEAESGATFTLASGTTFKVASKSNVVLRGLNISCINQVAQNFGILIQDSDTVTIDNCKVTDASGFGIFITASGSNTCQNIRVINSYVYGLGQNDVIGGGPANSTAVLKNVVVANNFVYQDCTNNPYENAFDIVRVNGVKVIGNHFTGKVQFGTEQYPNTLSDFSSNTIHPAINKTSTSVLVTTFASATSNNANISITNNVVDSGQIKVSGISSQLVKQLVIASNNIKCVNSANGLDLQYVTNAVVAGNSIYNAAAGVFFDNSTNSFVAANQLDTCVNAVKDNASVASIRIGQNSCTNISSTIYIGGSQAIELPKQTTSNLDGISMGGDTYLYRNAVSSIKTDGKLITGGQLGIVTNSPNSTLHINGSFSTAITTKSATFSPSITDHTFLCDASSGAIISNLPDCTNLAGREYTFIKLDNSVNSVTLDGFSTQTINGLTTLDITSQYAKSTIKTDGSNWYVVA